MLRLFRHLEVVYYAFKWLLAKKLMFRKFDDKVGSLCDKVRLLGRVTGQQYRSRSISDTNRFTPLKAASQMDRTYNWCFTQTKKNKLSHLRNSIFVHSICSLTKHINCVWWCIWFNRHWLFSKFSLFDH